MTTHLLQQYQQPLWGRMEPALRNCLAGAGILGVVFIIMVWVVPIPQRKPVTVTEVPERLARLILEKPAAPVAKSKPGTPESSRPETRAAEPEAAPVTAQPAPRTAPVRRAETQKVAADRGIEGRARATKDVTQNIASVTGSLDQVLDNIATQVPASRTSTDAKSSADAPGSARGRRGVRAGRTGTQLGSVGAVSGLSSADLSGSAIAGEGVTIAMITGLAGGGTGGGSGAPGSTGEAGGIGGADAGPGGSTHRSNESLLAVVRRYAPGIQFCYDNELRQTPGLRGKLVVAMVVMANGTVSEANIVEDTLNSPAVRDCALAQIRTWQFPAIPSGTTRFKTPFVFTPPSQ